MASTGAAPPCFTVLDVLGGLFSLRKRSPTLDGSVPLRAAQACQPLLEGNALGLQVALTRPLRLRRRVGGYALDADAGQSQPLSQLHELALTRLLAHGQLHNAERWQRELRQGIVWSEPGLAGLAKGRLWLWTGLLLKPDAGVWLRLMSAANRRHTGLLLSEVVFADDGAFVPLVLPLQVVGARPRELELHGELACLLPFAPAVSWQSRSLESDPEVGRAHARFYDAGYFAQKKHGVTRRYRRQISTAAVADRESAAPAAATCAVLDAGPCSFTVKGCEHFVSPHDPVPSARPKEPRRGEYVQFDNLLAFTCSFDGYAMSLGFDQSALLAKAEKLWQRFRALYGAEFVEQHKEAVAYLSRYFTTHRSGEPYFFVKPWAFVRTPPGWSCVVDGVQELAYDVLRGVVATDQFFVTPAVFFVRAQSRAIAVQEAAPLLRVLPIPRRLQYASYRTARLEAQG